MKARALLVFAVGVSVPLSNACSYDFQGFVGSNGGASGNGSTGRGGVESSGGEAGSDAGASGELSTGGKSATGGNGASGGKSATGGTTSGGKSSAGGVPSGGASSGGRSSSGGAMNGGSAGSGGTQSAGMTGVGGATCAGTIVSGVCWYLGAANQSCATVCTNRGGADSAAERVVGVPSQGGSLVGCALVLAALGVREVPSEATRTDGNGLGCYLNDGRSPTAYWLSSPRFSATARLSGAAIACGCVR